MKGKSKKSKSFSSTPKKTLTQTDRHTRVHCIFREPPDFKPAEAAAAAAAAAAATWCELFAFGVTFRLAADETAERAAAAAAKRDGLDRRALVNAAKFETGAG